MRAAILSARVKGFHRLILSTARRQSAWKAQMTLRESVTDSLGAPYGGIFYSSSLKRDDHTLRWGKASDTVRQYRSCSSMAADGNSEAAGQHGSHARLRHVTLKGVLNTILWQGVTVDHSVTLLNSWTKHPSIKSAIFLVFKVNDQNDQRRWFYPPEMRLKTTQHLSQVTKTI